MNHNEPYTLDGYLVIPRTWRRDIIGDTKGLSFEEWEKRFDRLVEEARKFVGAS